MSDECKKCLEMEKEMDRMQREISASRIRLNTIIGEQRSVINELKDLICQMVKR